MYKLLIVDDDETERRGIAGLPFFARYALSVAGEAWNGSQALEQALAIKPDIVLTDVRMPVMDGVTFAGHLKKALPSTRIILMSGFEDFESARQAVAIGADAYLTKPLRIDELESALRCAVGTLDSAAEDAYAARTLRERLESVRPFIKERLLRDLLLGVRSLRDKSARAEAEEAELFVPRSKLAVLLLADVHTREADVTPSMMELRDLLSRLCVTLNLSPPVFIHSGIFAVVASLPARLDDEGAFNHLQYCANHMLDAARAGCGRSLVAAISGIEEDEARLNAMYAQASETLRVHAWGTGAYWYAPAEQDAGSAADAIITMAGADPRVQAFLDTEDGMAALFEALAARWRDRPGGQRQEERPLRSASDALVEKAVAFIKGNFHKEISTDTISKEVYITPAHLRRVFKNVTGQTIQDYILAMRMDRARELLRGTDKKMLEIARSVGYESQSYFNVVFKKYCGRSPGEYRAWLMDGSPSEG
ncbi:MAG: helix-turn-helix domain-containing protein [Clostridiales bacterium]|jgi:two-component system response regulator YesN|nr:helix-turn-helix domain-containing protein [Clostridiales bacterium]